MNEVTEAAPEAPAPEATVVEPTTTPVEETAPAETEAPAPSEATPEPTEVPKAKTDGVQRRINELTRQRYEQQGRADQLQAELDTVRRTAVQSTHEHTKPHLEQYSTEQEYEQAMGAWVQQGVQRQQDEAQQAAYFQQQQSAQLDGQRQLQEKVAKATVKYPDFQTRINDPSLPPLGQINPTAYQAVVESDQMADVAMYLCENPAEVYSFAQMSPIQAVKAVAQIEAKLAAKPTVSAPPVAPPSSLGGRNEVAVDQDKMPIADWMAMRNKQLDK